MKLYRKAKNEPDYPDGSDQGGGSWTETILHNFQGVPTDGAFPQSDLVMDIYGNLYGTTLNGGTRNGGAVFELLPAESGPWTELVIHNFGGAPDGQNPMSSLVLDSSRHLYGTTRYGGAENFGTVFELSPAAGVVWTESILHNFNGLAGDGAFPIGGVLLDSNGNLYGTTLQGGASNCGAVFKLDR